jgi:hypothetical protein
MLWRRETGRSVMAGLVPATHAFPAQRTTARGGEVEKALFLRPLRPCAAPPGLVSEAARRGWPGEAPRRVGSSPPTANALRVKTEALTMLAVGRGKAELGKDLRRQMKASCPGLTRTSPSRTARAQGHSHRAPDRQLTRQSLPANPMRPPMAPLRAGKRRRF